LVEKLYYNTGGTGLSSTSCIRSSTSRA
jgi:hypothetical protein